MCSLPKESSLCVVLVGMLLLGTLADLLAVASLIDGRSLLRDRRGYKRVGKIINKYTTNVLN